MEKFRLIPLLTAAVMGCTALLAGCGKGSDSSSKAEEGAKTSDDGSINKDLTATELARLLGNGTNLGNTMEAYGHKSYSADTDPESFETLWGQPVTTEEMIKGMKASGFDSLEAAKEAGAAFVFMGHGTAHVAKVSYSQMSAQMQNLGYENVFIGTVEGEPEETSCESVIEAVKAAGYTNVILRPLMVVAGDHANNDMAGSDDDSWKTMFEAADFTVDCQIAGLGEIADIQALYIAHTQAAIDALNA